MPDTAQEKGKSFYRIFLIAAVVAIIGATIIIGMLYGCEREANPKPPRQPSTGMALGASRSSLQ
ncbi:MAG TPA: hypothetical protein VFR08_11560 [Candidatus Angelobacter sp.]|nr:hypothetical protein [Candidatus Angelobacter sp.]